MLQGLTDKPFWRQAMRLALPVALQNLLTASFALIDAVMIGGLGEESLAAVGMAGQWSWLMSLFMFGLSSGAAVFIAQFWGDKDLPGIHKSYGLLLCSTLCGALLFFAIAQIIPETVIGFFTPDRAITAEGALYLRFASLSYIAIAVTQAFSTTLRFTEQVRLPMIAGTAAVVLNIALNAVFIYGFQMGVAGAGLATAISAWSTPVVLFLVSYKRRNIIIAPLKRLLDWNRVFISGFFTVSAPVLMNEFLWALGTTGIYMIFGNLDTQFYAALTIFKTIENLCLVLIQGLCHACAVMVGKCVGSGELKRAHEIAGRFTAIVIAASALIGLALIALRPFVMTAFNVSAAADFAAKRIMLFHGLEMWVRNIPFIIIVGIFRAGGDTRTGLVYDLVFIWLVSLPLTAICALALKMPLVWVFSVVLLAEDIGKSFFCVRRFFTRKWIMPVTAAGKSALDARKAKVLDTPL